MFVLVACALGIVALVMPVPDTLAACSGESNPWCVPAFQSCSESCGELPPELRWGCQSTCNREYRQCAIQNCDPTDPHPEV